MTVGSTFDSPDLLRRTLLQTGLAAGVGQVAPPSPANGIPGAAGAANAAAPATWVTAFMSPRQLAQAQAGDLVDCTEAFQRAQQAGTIVWIPPGRYGLSGLRLLDGRSLIGVGENVVRLDQLSPELPAIDCRSDQESGQLSGITVKGVTIHGHPLATVAVFVVAAYDAHAIWRCDFQYVARQTYRSLEVQGADAANVFYCRFDVVSEGTRDSAVLVNGGTYNVFQLFLTKCRGMAIIDSSANAQIRAITENCMSFMGQNNRIWPTLEELPLGPATNVGVEDRGFGNTFETPTVIMSQDNLLEYGFKPFSHSIFINPQIIGKQDAVLHPFDLGIGHPFTVIGGRSQAGNPVETVYDGRSERARIELITFVGGSTGLRRS